MINVVVEVLMHRDDLTEEEATDLVKEAIDEMEQAGWDYSECEDIMNDLLGLEMDYIIYLT